MGRSKPVKFADDMIVYIESPEVSTKKKKKKKKPTTLELINEIRKDPGTRLIYRYLLLFYTLIMNYQRKKAENNLI